MILICRQNFAYQKYIFDVKKMHNIAWVNISIRFLKYIDAKLSLLWVIIYDE